MAIKSNAEPTNGNIVMTDLQMASTLQLAASEAKPNAEEPYAPFKNRTNTSVTDVDAMAHLLKGSLGTGILAMPNAFRNAGLAFGMVGTILSGLLCTHCIHILVRSSHILCHRTRSPVMDYAETAEMAFDTGPWGSRKLATSAKWFVNVCLCATYYSAGVVYIIFIAQSIKTVGDAYFEELHIRVYIVIFMVPLCLMVLIRNLKYLVPFSMLSNLFIFTSFCITLAYIFTDLPSVSSRKNIADPIQIPLFFSTVVFAMEGIGVVMPVENAMKKPGHFLGCPGILNISMGIVVTLYAIIGFFGYVKYGEETKGSVTFNLSVLDPWGLAVQILMAVAIFFTFGLQMYVPCKITWEGMQHYISKKWENIANYGFRISVVLVEVCIAVAVPNLGPVISLVGAVCFSTLGLLCPAIIETVTCWEDDLGVGKWRLYKNIIIMVLSLCVLFAGAYTSILDIISTYGIH